MTNTVEAIAIPSKMRHLQLLFWRHLSFNAVRSLLLKRCPLPVFPLLRLYLGCRY
ncbi:hypothetical protein [Microcoleus sp. FACHB-SPT15]|uniref:hypothetical protein n=1 Tax=Microcoleus sp. FACHB-SPT15 TaxID=2692830 RepID=UPI001F552604|nr:hypothetical protein [Microcoleus sp. FACHB-SPT15]